MKKCHGVGLHFYRFLIIILLLAFLPAGCFHFWPHSGGNEEKVSLTKQLPSKSGQCPRRIPFVKPEDNHYGSAALAMVLRYYDYPVEPREILKYIQSKNHKSAHISDLALFALKCGFKASICSGTLEGLKEAIDDKTPVIILIKDNLIPFLKKERYIVVFAFDDVNKTFIVHGDHASQKISYSSLLRRWKEKKSLMLIVSPKKALQ